MIPDLPLGCSVDQQIDFYEKLLDTNEGQGLVHIHWHTHRNDPSLCWICDRATLAHKCLNIAEEALLSTKSDPDMETSLVHDSELDSEIESENDLNHNEEAVPEYDVVDGQESEESS